jgi:pyruvate kinase
MIRRTKIVSTLSADASTDDICKLIDAGLNVARLDFSTNVNRDAYGTVLDNFHAALKSRSGVHVATMMDLERTGNDVLSEKDLADVRTFAIPRGINFLAVTIRSGEEIVNLRKQLHPRGRHLRIIAKPEGPIADIAKEADAVLLDSTNDVAAASSAGTVVIVKTDTDVAGVVSAYADAALVSAVAAAADTMLKTEATMTYTPRLDAADEVSQSCVDCVKQAVSSKMPVILVLTETGYTARKVAMCRPQMPIFVLAAAESVIRQLQLVANVTAVQVPSFQGTEHVTRIAGQRCQQMGLVKNGDEVILIQGLKEEMDGHSSIVKNVAIEG